ncbi:MAG: anti-sigma factor [Myxococcota bacterium]|jgi:anti-sigma factor RsiW
MAENKNVGGLWCFDVLERLSDYIDGELPAAERAQVERHLAGCDECTKFGGEFGAVVRGLRAKLGAKDDAPADVARRLDEALSKR